MGFDVLLEESPNGFFNFNSFKNVSLFHSSFRQNNTYIRKSRGGAPVVFQRSELRIFSHMFCDGGHVKIVTDDCTIDDRAACRITDTC